MKKFITVDCNDNSCISHDDLDTALETLKVWHDDDIRYEDMELYVAEELEIEIPDMPKLADHPANHLALSRFEDKPTGSNADDDDLDDELED